MEYEEIKKLTDAELAEKIAGERIMLGKLKLQHGVSPIENPMRVRTQRKLVAKLLTESSARKHNGTTDKQESKSTVASAPKKENKGTAASAPKKENKGTAKSAPKKESKSVAAKTKTK